jgi:pantothenate kinase type III
VIATGGLADTLFGVSRTIDVVDHDLTLYGLKLIHDRGRGVGGTRG